MAVIEKLKIKNAQRTFWSLNNEMNAVHSVLLVSEIDAEPMNQIRSQAKAKGEIAHSYTAFVVKATALLLKNNPEANRGIIGLPFLRRLCQFKNIDITVAVEKELPDLPGQPWAATIPNTLNKNLQELTLELHRLATSTPENEPRLKQFIQILKNVPYPLSSWILKFPRYFPSMWAKYLGCGAWVNSPAKAGVDMIAAVWPWPLTVSFGMVRSRPVVVNGQIEARLTMPLILAFDRRILGGGPASRLLIELKHLLEHPDQL